jgi:hypothetical protein
MQAQLSQTNSSYYRNGSPTVFGEIFSMPTSVACWQRSENPIIRSYFKAVSPSLAMGVRHVFSMSSLKKELNAVLPQGIGKEMAVGDIHLLADMLTCLFDCNEVGLRLTATQTAMCPRFHVDNIPVRLITTYLGPGTQWLPNESANPDKLGHAAGGMSDDKSGLYDQDLCIEQMDSFDVALLKGSAWSNDHVPAIHRSCALAEGQWRVVLTLDPI